MRENINKFKDFLLNESKKVDLYKKYGNVIFSEDFYKQDENMIKYLEKTYLTKEGYENLKNELDFLINSEKPRNLQEVKEARAQGDLSENADYHAAREEQAEIALKIKILETKLENAEIIKATKSDKIVIGSFVKIKYTDDDEEDEYQIVGNMEADPLNSKISNESPIAIALLGKELGDIADVESPNGTYSVEIIGIS